jgi:hypothetical protein
MQASLTSAVFGTLSQNTSILMSPSVVCSVTDMVGRAMARQHCCPWPWSWSCEVRGWLGAGSSFFCSSVGLRRWANRNGSAEAEAGLVDVGIEAPAEVLQSML